MASINFEIIFDSKLMLKMKRIKKGKSQFIAFHIQTWKGPFS